MNPDKMISWIGWIVFGSVLLLCTVTILILSPMQGALAGILILFGIVLGTYLAIVTVSVLERFTTTIPAKTLLVDQDNQIHYRLAKETKYWSKTWREISHGLKQLRWEQLRIEVSSQCSPITDNPKVREIQYTVRASIVENPEEYAMLFGADGSLHPEEVKIQSTRDLSFWLYEFNNSYSKRLAEFYNPLDKQQQEAFSGLLINYLREKMAGSPLCLTSARFELAN